MSVVGVGVDIVDIQRMEDVLQATPTFKSRIYTKEERTYCERGMRPVARYATHFAAREAVLKALGTGFKEAGTRSVSVTHDEKGQPQVILTGKAAEIAASQGVIAIHLSLSTTHDVAVANAVAVSDEEEEEVEEEFDQELEMRRSFKEALSVLDELDNLQKEQL